MTEKGLADGISRTLAKKTPTNILRIVKTACESVKEFREVKIYEMTTKEEWVKWVREGQTEITIPQEPFQVQAGWYQLKGSELIPINVEVPI
ncbi:hypothetical protein Ciccas_012259, partial [Cichlidogyrus casuarinus]